MSYCDNLYCENCFKDSIKQDECINDEQGGIFCTEECKEDFKQIRIENRGGKNEKM